MFTAVRTCKACQLHETCKACVPGHGPVTKKGIMLIGEAPGAEEDMKGVPFVGKSGMELDRMLRENGLDRSLVYVTNLVKGRPPNNRDPKPDEVLLCTDTWLLKEISELDPWLIITVGRHSMNWVRAEANLPPATMEREHGRPFKLKDATVIPCYHPAAGLHNPKIMHEVEEDFAVVGMLVNGLPPEKLLVEDEYPEVEYFHQDLGPGEMAFGLPEVAVDTEWGADKKFFSAQWAGVGGSATLTKTPLIVTPFSEVVAHNWLADAPYISLLSKNHVVDTMVAAYLLGLPQGLKVLARRLCGMEMQDYEDVVLPYRRDKAMNYLGQALGVTAGTGQPAKVLDEEWDNKKGKLVTRWRQPQHISTKIGERLKKAGESAQYDPYASWMEIPPVERLVVESAMGVMPDAWLSDVPFDKALYYACRDPDATLRVWRKLRPMMEEKGLMFIFELADMPILNIVQKMMNRGMVVDVSWLQMIQAQHGQRMKELAEEIAVIAGHGVNPNSGPQVVGLLYDELKFKVTKRTMLTNVPVTDDRELKKINHPVIQPILDYRQSNKIKGTYADPLIPRAVMDPERAIHTTLTATRTSTGRLASKDPNLQNIPIRNDYGREVRDAFIARPGYTLLSLDYSQIEVRIFAYIVQAKHFIQMFKDHRDVHSENAAMFFKVPVEQVTEYQRYGTKRGTFGWLYWISPEGLTETMHEEGAKDWTLEDSANLIASLDKQVPEMTVYRAETVAFGRREGYVQDLMGRMMWTPALRSDIDSIRSAAEREAANMPIQAGAQEVIKLAMVKIDEEMERVTKWDPATKTRKKWSELAYWLLQIHDELVFEVPVYLVKDFARWVKEIMEGVVSLGEIPVEVGVKVATRWGSMEKLNLG